MIKDFLTYNPDNIIELTLRLPGDEEIRNLVETAKSLDSFVRISIKELHHEYKKQGQWFEIIVMFKDHTDATWFRLKFAELL